MVRSAPPENASLPEVMTQPLIASSPATVSTICDSSSITSGVMTFIERPGMSQVAMRDAVGVDLEAEIGEVHHGLLLPGGPVIPDAAKRRCRDRCPSFVVLRSRIPFAARDDSED